MLVWTLQTMCLEQGTLVVLSLTLIAVIWYTYFTHQLAVKREPLAVAASIRYDRQSKEVLIIARNPTNCYLGTRLWVEVEVYGQKTDLGDDYTGKTVWHLTPYFEIKGHFSLEQPLKQVGKTFSDMVSEANGENQTRQLRLFLRVAWEDEGGKQGAYPAPHRWYFDFRRNEFVYQVGPF